MIDEKQMTLAVDFRGQVSPVGWHASEKLDGCRAMWDGHQFWTRGGKIIAAPKWFTRDLPKISLDGEIWCGRTGFQSARVAVQNGGRWFDVPFIQFAAFDSPDFSGTWRDRLVEVRRAVKGSANAVAVKSIEIRDIHHFVDYLTKLRKLGAEGSMFRSPGAVGYDLGRSNNLLRFKYDCN